MKFDRRFCGLSFRPFAANRLNFVIAGCAGGFALKQMTLVRFAAAVAAVMLCTVPAVASELLDGCLGTYTTDETNFVTVKRLTFFKDKDGSIKVRGALVGFPDEVSLGETVPEECTERNNKTHPDLVIVSFASDKFKPMIVCRPSSMPKTHFESIQCDCYMRDVDGKYIHVQGWLKRTN